MFGVVHGFLAANMVISILDFMEFFWEFMGYRNMMEMVLSDLNM
jgi:hypothetical protein